MKIGLIDVDGHNWPNLCLMKLSAHHKARGDTVDWWNGFEQYDRVYMSKVFTEAYTPDMPEPWNTGELCKGGTGYGLEGQLPENIEHTYPDYDLYPQYTQDTAFGFLTRGCPRNCGFCIVGKKEGLRSYRVAQLEEFWQGQRFVKLLDPNLLACPEHEAILAELAACGAWVDFTQGLDARLLSEDNTRLLKCVKTKRVHFAWDSEQHSDLIVRNLTRFKQQTGLHYTRAIVYVLVNYDTSHEFDLHRIYALRDMGYHPYVMVYDKPNAPSAARRLQGWVNNRRIWASCERFEDYSA